MTPMIVEHPLLQDVYKRQPFHSILLRWEVIRLNSIFSFLLSDEENSIVIMEGIHALNPLVTGENNFATCVYISVRTRLKTSENRVLHPRLIRLMRRLCRDSLFRGRDLPAIFSYFESVSEGEEKYILPFKYRADFQIDTFMSYEVPVYKSFLYTKLIEVQQIFSGNICYKNIVDFLSLLLPVSEKNVPESSLIREFIG